MSAMLEKAARALADHFGCEWGTMRDADRETIRGYVRAVLLAVREPDQESITRACDREHHCEDLRIHFTAMIDTILAEETGT